jgi:hypothetical protein
VSATRIVVSQALPYVIAPVAIVVGFVGFQAEEFFGTDARDKVRWHSLTPPTCTARDTTAWPHQDACVALRFLFHRAATVTCGFVWSVTTRGA